MLDFIKNLMGGGSKVNYSELVKEGNAVIIDVRSKAEYDGGHIEGSLNIPLSNLQGSLSKIDKNKTVITCCASGIRSGSAKSILKSNGYAEVYNGGGWVSLQNKLD